MPQQRAAFVGSDTASGFELGPWNIQVNYVAPGPIGGGMFASLPAENREKLLQGIRLGVLEHSKMWRLQLHI
mgnify:CR=1 FL=1